MLHTRRAGWQRISIMANGAQEYKLLWESSPHADGDAELGPEGEVGEDADAVVGRGVDEADAEAVIARTHAHAHKPTHTNTHMQTEACTHPQELTSARLRHACMLHAYNVPV